MNAAEMITMLYSLTSGEYWGNKTDFNNHVFCGKSFAERFFNEMTEFHDNGQTIEIYGKKRYSCNYTLVGNVRFITSIYGRDGLVWETDINIYDLIP